MGYKELDDLCEKFYSEIFKRDAVICYPDSMSLFNITAYQFKEKDVQELIKPIKEMADRVVFLKTKLDLDKRGPNNYQSKDIRELILGYGLKDEAVKNALFMPTGHMNRMKHWMMESLFGPFSNDLLIVLG